MEKLKESEKINPQDEPKLSVYQKLLLAEIQKKPELMNLMKAIFNDYPQIILSEHITGQGVTNKNKRKSIELARLRMKMESYIEEKISRLAGIDVDKFAALQKESENIEKAKTLEGSMDVATDQIAKEVKEEEDQKALDGVTNTVEGESNEGNGSSSSAL